MARRKQRQKADFNASTNCINADPGIKGHWAAHFGNERPLVLEIGCGKGDHTVALAHRDSEHNYVGVDVKAARMIAGARLAREHNVENVAFLRTYAEGLTLYFAPGEVKALWITFPDPFPKKKQTARRLIHEGFLKIYLEVLPDGGEIRFKTDNLSLFDYMLLHFEELEQKGVFHFERLALSRDVHADPAMRPIAAVTTEFERRFLEIGKPIHYIHFRLFKGPNIDQVPATEPVALDLDEKAPRQKGPGRVEI